MTDDFDPADYLRPPEVALAWGWSPGSVRRAIRDGRLPALVTPNGRYMVHKRDAVLRPAVTPPS